MAELTQRLDQLQMLLSTVQAPAPAPAAPDGFEPPSYLTPEEKQEWGEVLPIIEKRANELMAVREHEFQKRIDQLESMLQGQGQKVQRSARAALMSFMDNHPSMGVASDISWRDVNVDENFKEWLSYPDIMSGRTRQSLLEDAFNTNDAPRFAAIFESFLREAGHYPAPAAAKTNGSGIASHEPPAPNGLERFAAPGPARTAPVPTGPTAVQEIFTTGDITRFYADKRTGRWKGREQEAAEYERRLVAAANSGRTKPGPPSP
jgi:hypothetical protein